MNREQGNPEIMLDRAIGEVRDEAIDPAVIEQARRRAWERIARAAESGETVSQQIDNCAGFRALMPAYRDGTLAPGRRMLLEDHTHECVACRKVLHGAPAAGAAAATPKVVAMPERRAPSWRRYAVAAAVLVTAGLSGRYAYDRLAPGPEGPRAVIASTHGNVYRISLDGLRAVSAGAEIGESEMLRTGPDSRATLKLRDGSVVEVNERAEFAVTMDRRDTTVRLERGTVIVQAAKRASGHLFVTSPDCRVAVTGTVFAVNRGMKGSRVSVVEGEVRVDRSAGQTVLRPGDQVTTHDSVGNVPIEKEISWSPNAEQHIALLREFVQLKEKLETIPLPGLRTSSRLLDLAPTSTVMYVSIPNLGPTLAEANRLFQDQLQQSTVLREWWERSRGGKRAPNVQEVVDRVRRFSDYLGEEIVFALSVGGDQKGPSGVVIAEVQRAGLREFIEAELAKMAAAGNPDTDFQVIEGPGPVKPRGPGHLLVVLHGNRVVAGENAALIDAVLRNIDTPTAAPFSATEFGRAISETIHRGTGILLAADLQRMSSLDKGAKSNTATFERMGLRQAKFLLAEQKPFGKETQHSAVIRFDGARQGIASWLGAPAAIGGLGFISPDAQVVWSAVLKNPEQLLADLFAVDPEQFRRFQEAQRKGGIDIAEIAKSLGSEVTFAIDGPLVPTVSWKAALEVTNAAALQETMERFVRAGNLLMEIQGVGSRITLDNETSDGRVFYQLRTTGGQMRIPEIHYVYTEGYLLAAPSRALLLSSMQNRQAGVTLVRSDKFRSLLPADHHANFSGMVYQNAGKWIGSVGRALGNGEQQDAAEAVAAMGPVLVCAYGETDRIEIASKASAWSMVMQAALAPMLHRGSRSEDAQSPRTLKPRAAYR